MKRTEIRTRKMKLQEPQTQGDYFRMCCKEVIK